MLDPSGRDFFLGTLPKAVDPKEKSDYENNKQYQQNLF
jgi:hypothetical protein